MKKLVVVFKIIFVIGIIVGVGIVFRKNLVELSSTMESRIHPCQQPILYSIGTFDKRFGITQDSFLKAVAQAADIWGKPLGRPLFQYSETGTLKINLVYDNRQDATEKLKKLGMNVDNGEAGYKVLKAKFDSLNNVYKKDQAGLQQKKIDAFQTAKTAYESEVAYWNNRGGAPEKEYNKLQGEKKDLDSQAAVINELQNNANSLVDTINALAVTLNRQASELNINVSTYNTIGAQQGVEFEEGVYETKGLDKSITIYQFDSQEKLVRVLAHEFGHALGLEHVEDPKAIMYRLNQGTNSVLSSADLTELNKVCVK